MPPTYSSGAFYDYVDVMCYATVTLCRALRADPSRSPQRALSPRRIQLQTLVHFLAVRAQVAVNLLLLQSEIFNPVGSEWVETVPNVTPILAAVGAGNHGEAPTPAARILTALVAVTKPEPPISSTVRDLGAFWSKTAALYLLHLSSCLEHETIQDAAGDIFIHRDVDAAIEASSPGRAFNVDLHNAIVENSCRITFAGNIDHWSKCFGVCADAQAGLGLAGNATRRR